MPRKKATETQETKVETKEIKAESKETNVETKEIKTEIKENEVKTNENEKKELSAEAEKVLAYSKELREIHKKQMALVMVTDTPYFSTPNINQNFAGFIPKGQVCYVEQELDNGTNGKLFKINEVTYLNKNFDYQVL